MKNFLSAIPSKVILVSASMLILIHVMSLIFYTHKQNINEHAAQRDVVLQKIMNVVQIANDAPEQQLDKAITAFNDEELSVDISTTPKFPITIISPDYWKIHKKIPEDARKVEVSMQVKQRDWINLSTEIRATPADEFFIILLEIMIALIILFYAWSIDRFTKPLHDFRIAAQRLGVDIHSETALSENYHGPAIVRETAEAMNQLQQRIKDLLADRTEMLAAISHDLRTPITRLKLRCNMLEDDELAKKNLRDLDEMDTMIGEILMFARGDYTSEEKSNIDLISMLQSICDDANDIGGQASLQTKLKRFKLNARPVTLKRALSNLIHNAIKYGDIAKVTVTHFKDNIVIAIRDQGPGIPEDELENVFTAFHRVDASRSRNVAGTGLGLTIARDAILAHNGKIEIMNRDDRSGLDVVVTLYI